MILLYIDPGTGSMLFSVFLGIAAALYFFSRRFLIKIKSFVFGKNKIIVKRSDFVIYNEGDHYWPVFSPIVEEFENRQIYLLYFTSSKTDPVFNNNYIYVHPEYIGSGNKAFTVLNFIETDICLMTTPGLEVYQLKRSKFCSHYSHILHDVGDATCYRLFGIDYYDSIFLSGDYQKKDIRELEKSRSLSQKELVIVGSTYLDDYNKKLENYPEEPNHVFTVLVSPSWGPGSLLNVLGDKLLDSLKDTQWRIIVRPHPQSKKSETEFLEGLEKKHNYCIWDYKSENIDSLSKADIMISDFSSIVFDFAFLFNRPVIYHNAAFKKDMYDAGDFEHEPWKFETVKRFGIELLQKDIPNIKKIVLDAVSNTSLLDEQNKAKEIAWQNRYQSGKAVVDTLLAIKENNINNRKTYVY